MFGDITGAVMHCSTIGLIAEDAWQDPSHYIAGLMYYGIRVNPAVLGAIASPGPHSSSSKNLLLFGCKLFKPFKLFNPFDRFGVVVPSSDPRWHFSRVDQLPLPRPAPQPTRRGGGDEGSLHRRSHDPDSV